MLKSKVALLPVALPPNVHKWGEKTNYLEISHEFGCIPDLAVFRFKLFSIHNLFPIYI